MEVYQAPQALPLRFAKGHFGCPASYPGNFRPHCGSGGRRGGKIPLWGGVGRYALSPPDPSFSDGDELSCLQENPVMIPSRIQDSPKSCLQHSLPWCSELGRSRFSSKEMVKAVVPESGF